MFVLTMNFMLINNSFPIQFNMSFLVCFFVVAECFSSESGNIRWLDGANLIMDRRKK